MEYLAKLNAPVLGFSLQGDHIDCLCGKKLQKLGKKSGNLIYEREIFEKEGLARNMCVDNGQIFISDFCTLYAFSQDRYELLGQWQLGEDLSSDICGMTIGKNTVYCSIRNGKLITVDRASFLRRIMWSCDRDGLFSLQRNRTVGQEYFGKSGRNLHPAEIERLHPY